MKVTIRKQILINLIKEYGEKLPKKHGDWYRVHVYDKYYLLLDTWTNHISLYEGCEDTGTDNMYRVVYTFNGFIESLIHEWQFKFWYAHLQILKGRHE